MVLIGAANAKNREFWLKKIGFLTLKINSFSRFRGCCRIFSTHNVSTSLGTQAALLYPHEIAKVCILYSQVLHHYFGITYHCWTPRWFSKFIYQSSSLTDVKKLMVIRSTNRCKKYDWEPFWPLYNRIFWRKPWATAPPKRKKIGKFFSFFRKNFQNLRRPRVRTTRDS